MRLAPLAIILPASLMPAANGLAAEYLSVPLAQRDLFPEADRFVDAKLTLTDEQRDAIKQLSGVRQREAAQPVWRAEQNGRLLGWFIVDEVIGKHEFITYATAIAPTGKVIGVDVLVYRETYGFQIRDAEWRNQFKGRTLQDHFKLDDDIRNITGATLSSRNVMNGVKRLLALAQVALQP
jgi:Na+-translocating ferredoxin:NAD+ oxidoreductase RnfG subunit